MAEKGYECSVGVATGSRIPIRWEVRHRILRIGAALHPTARSRAASLNAPGCYPMRATLDRIGERAFAESTAKRQAVTGRHKPVPAPVFLRAPCRAHHDRTMISDANLGRCGLHEPSTVTSKTKWRAPVSAPASPTRRTDDRIAPGAPPMRL